MPNRRLGPVLDLQREEHVAHVVGPVQSVLGWRGVPPPSSGHQLGRAVKTQLEEMSNTGSALQGDVVLGSGIQGGLVLVGRACRRRSHRQRRGPAHRLLSVRLVFEEIRGAVGTVLVFAAEELLPEGEMADEEGGWRTPTTSISTQTDAQGELWAEEDPQQAWQVAGRSRAKLTASGGPSLQQVQASPKGRRGRHGRCHPPVGAVAAVGVEILPELLLRAT